MFNDDAVSAKPWRGDIIIVENISGEFCSYAQAMRRNLTLETFYIEDSAENKVLFRRPAWETILQLIRGDSNQGKNIRYLF